MIVSLDGLPEVHDKIRRVERAFALLETGIQAAREKSDRRCESLRAQRCRRQITAICGRRFDVVWRLNLNGISFLAVGQIPDFFCINRPLLWSTSHQEEIALSLLEVGVLEREIESLVQETSRESECGFIAETPEKLRRIARQFRVQLGLKTGESPICNAPWVSAVIETDGTVRPCFFHEAIGNLRDGSLESIINGEAGRAFRENLDIAKNAICQRCVCSLHYRA